MLESLPLRWRRRLAPVFLCASMASASAMPVISEIFYHEDHGTNPENPLTEWIEIHNPTGTPLDLSGWSLTDGVRFTFPAAASIPAGGFVVVVADVATFNANHPSVDNGSNVFGPWFGRLRNSGEKIELADGSLTEIDKVDFADEGDWATRARGPTDLGHEGWIWDAPHDGGGRSLELINPALSNNQGQNWAPSTTAGGTPGAANSVASTDIAPMILNVKHWPKIPTASETVRVSADLRDELTAGLSATLHWRVDGASPSAFDTIAMTDDGTGEFIAVIPAHADGTIIEFFIEASDGTNARTWPAASQPSGLQETNVLYQVDDGFDSSAPPVPGKQPEFRLIMTEAERAELEQLGTTPSESGSNAQMNGTMITLDGTDEKTRYRVGIRIRGNASRNQSPNSYRVNIPSDDHWYGRSEINLNTQYTHSQLIGAEIFRRAGIVTAAASAVQVRVNGANLASPGSEQYGSYVFVEPLGSEFADRRFPLDSAGNVYRCSRQGGGGGPVGQEADLRWEGNDPDSYRDTYFKNSNTAADDFSDLIGLTNVLNNAPAAGYVDAVRGVADLDQWLRHIALDALLGNRESGLNTGDGDDYALYRGVADTRFLIVPHDLDTVLGEGNTSSNFTQDIFNAASVAGLSRILDHPDLIPLYYAELLELMDTVYNPATLYPLLDDTLGSWVPVPVVARMKQFIADRIANVLSQIPQDFSITSDLQVTQEGYARTTDGAALLSGTFHAARTLSVLINGVEATIDAKAGTWTLDIAAGSGFLKAGINRVVVQAFDGRSGTGALVDEGFIDVYFDTGTTVDISGALVGGAPQGSVHLATRDTYLPGVPVLVRVELRNEDGTFNRNRWDATATLSTNQPGITLTPSTVTLYNGLGSALVRIGGGTGGIPVTLIQPGSMWNYLDDGSDQGTAWRGSEFDDSAWKSGPAELGYGDNDEMTELLYGPNADNALNDEDNKFITYYFRKTFEVVAASNITSLSLRVKRDDGGAIYLNGTEVARDNLPADPGYQQLAQDGSAEEDDFLQFTVDPALLVDGTNLIAAEIHQADVDSSDVSFDLELTGSTPTADPGNFTLTATLDGRQVSKGLTSLGTSPAITSVSGTLGGGATTTWNGIVRLTDDVTVPAGHTLNIDPGALILIDGTSTAQSEDGKDLIVQGVVNCSGTEAQPITITATDPDAPWGQIRFDQSEGASFRFTNIHRAGHAPGGGHTGHGRVLRILGSTVSFDDCSLTDNRGKLGETDSQGGQNSDMAFRRCHWARSVMGIESFNTAVLLDDCYITEMLGIYREDGVTDDDDAIYLHDAAAGQSMVLRRLVVARTDDDGIDTLGAEGLVIEDVICRDCFDKGMSVNGGSVSVVRGLFVENDIGISAKNDGNVTLDFVTSADNTSIQIQAENKTGSDPPSFFTISNSILWGGDPIRTDYDPTDIVVTHSDVGETWPPLPAPPEPSNINEDPLFVNAAGDDYHLTAASPAKDAADPALPQDPDMTNQDMGYYPYDPLFDAGGGGPAAGEVRWTVADGPYHVTGNVIVPTDVTLVIDPGTTIFYDPDTELTVNGIIKAEGTPFMRIRMASLPGATFVPDIRPELPLGPPRWDGIQIVNSMSSENIISHVDIEFAQSSDGAIGVDHSEVIIDNVTFRGTHQRMIFTDTSSVIVQNCAFPDMFAPDEFPLEMSPPIDNAAEHIKGSGGIPNPGHYIIRNNVFGTNKGHNDIIDVDSNQLPDPILQILNNEFTGSGDEAVDGGGDILVEGNRFANFIKDRDNDGSGDSNCITTSDTLTSVMMITRNVFVNIDHVVNFKKEAFGYVENNTVVGITAPHLSLDTDPPSRLLDFSAINFLIPNEIDPVNGPPRDPAGRGAYTSSNLFVDIPQSVFGHPDLNPTLGGIISQLEVHNSLVESDGVWANADNVNGRAFHYLTGGARFVDKAGGDFRLLPDSPGVKAGASGIDVGAMVPSGATISGEPIGVTTSDSATLTIGGPGIFSFIYKVNDGPWSTEVTISDRRDFDTPPLVRSAQIQLASLVDGDYTVRVRGRNFAGVLQEESTATVSRTWTVSSAAAISSIVINEVLAGNTGAVDHEGTVPDVIELYNNGTLPFELSDMSISDDPTVPRRFVFPPGTSVNPGDYLLLYADIGAATSGIHLEFALDDDGEGVYLYDTPAKGGALVDSVIFGLQIPDLSLGRSSDGTEWDLNVPTLGGANIAQPLGDPRLLRINEYLASGAVSFVDDFIELYNPDTVPVALGGLFLTDDHLTEPGKHAIAPLSFIAAEGFAVFKADGNQSAGPDHLSFGLDSNLESIALYTANLEEIDLVLYGPQTTDYSAARTTDGGTDFEYRQLPTPGVRGGGINTVVQHLDLLEVTDVWSYEQSGTDLQTAWREPGFDDSGWSQGGGLLFFDDDSLPAPKTTELTLGEITYYFRTTFTIDEDPANVALLLSSYVDDGAVVYLNGVEVLRIGMDPPPAVIDFNTLADRTVGDADLEGPFPIPTGSLVSGDNVLAVEVHQGSSNSSDVVFGLELDAAVTTMVPTGDPEFDRALAILDALRITEIMFNPQGSDEGFEFVELKNTGDSALDLTGVRFTDGIGFVFPTFILGPGEYVVLSPDIAKFESLYGVGINVLGPYSGKLDNGGEPILVQLPEPYDAGILRFRYNDWYPEADGGGHSLNLVDPLAQRDTWGERESWRVGGLLGSPGGNFSVDAGSDQVIVLPTDANLTAILDRDGEVASADGFSISWQQIEGPGVAAFTDPTMLATGVAFSASGTYVLGIELVGNGTFASDQLEIVVDDTYEAWAVRLGVGLPGENDDLDGMDNLIEYAFDTDPHAVTEPPFAISLFGGELFGIYPRALRKSDITYRAEQSSNLKIWTAAPETLMEAVGSDVENWRAAIPDSADRAWLRIVVEKP